MVRGYICWVKLKFNYMKKVVNIISLIIFTCLLFGCSTFEFEGEITAELIDDQIRIENLTNTNVYYHAGDASVLASIYTNYDISRMPYIEPGKICFIDIEKVSYYDDETTGISVIWMTKHGDRGSEYLEL